MSDYIREGCVVVTNIIPSGSGFGVIEDDPNEHVFLPRALIINHGFGGVLKPGDKVWARMTPNPDYALNARKPRWITSYLDEPRELRPTSAGEHMLFSLVETVLTEARRAMTVEDVVDVIRGDSLPDADPAVVARALGSMEYQGRVAVIEIRIRGVVTSTRYTRFPDLVLHHTLADRDTKPLGDAA